jgi:hypothetical protein
MWGAGVEGDGGRGAGGAKIGEGAIMGGIFGHKRRMVGQCGRVPPRPRAQPEREAAGGRTGGESESKMKGRGRVVACGGDRTTRHSLG